MNKSQPTHRENFLMSLLHKVIKEYKELLKLTKQNKLFKIVEITSLSSIPGETSFAIQISNKNCVLPLKASEIFSKKYDLNDFSDFHAELIRQAAQGKLIEFLKLAEKDLSHKIAEKRFDRTSQQYIFTIETPEKAKFPRTAQELSSDKKLLYSLDIIYIYDIGYTQGCESILKEKTALLLAKANKNDKYLHNSE